MKSSKHSNLFNPQIFIFLLFVVVSLFSFFVPYFKLDISIENIIQGINSAIFSQVMWFVTLLGNQPLMVFIVAATCAGLYAARLKAEAIILTLVSAGGTLSGSLVKMIINRPRPAPSLVRVSVFLSDKSYPSNHVLVFTVFFGFLLFLLIKRTTHRARGIVPAILFILLISTIGISRIYLGAHWPSDVIGGYLLGIIWLLIAIRLYNSYHGQR